MDRVEDAGAADDAPVEDVRPSSTANGSGTKSSGDIDDVGGDSAPTTGEHGGEAEEA